MTGEGVGLEKLFKAWLMNEQVASTSVGSGKFFISPKP